MDILPPHVDEAMVKLFLYKKYAPASGRSVGGAISIRSMLPLAGEVAAKPA